MVPCLIWPRCSNFRKPHCSDIWIFFLRICQTGAVQVFPGSIPHIIHNHKMIIPLAEERAQCLKVLCQSTDCFSKRSEFSNQHSHGSAQPSVTPVPENLVPFSDLCRHQTCRWNMEIHAEKNNQIEVNLKLTKNHKPYWQWLNTFCTSFVIQICSSDV